MKQSGTSTPLQGAVQDLASSVVSALRGGDHAHAAVTTAGAEAGGLAYAAIRVLGADMLLPSTLLHTPTSHEELAVFRKVVETYTPAPDATPPVAWSHWGMRSALRRLDPGYTDSSDRTPDASWLDGASWQHLTHQLAVLASLALPGEDSAVVRVAGSRPVDVARGFVRAVRRRDWLQAAGAGRWLTVLDGVPETLGLERGLDFVELMGGQDPRVELQLRAARLLEKGPGA
ncbi:hypothetical protein [Streptomyces sp. NPDC007984]|uniref:hypothetical protein n=1 Tax=Streptomyces sp. NPDC007984 TaxID=3364801 RepID=UPI0036F08A11